MKNEIMTPEERRRYDWLQIMARIDNDYSKLISSCILADDLFLELRQKLSEDQYAKVQQILAANAALEEGAFRLAAKYLILRGESVSSFPPQPTDES